MQEPVRVYTPRTLAHRWRCSDQHVRNLIARGELKAFRARGKLLRITAEEVGDYERRNGSP
jgi:excisionase family DNA binding protein